MKKQQRKSIVDGKVIINSDHIKALLAVRYGAGSSKRADTHVFLTEVRSSTGFYSATRYADGFAMSMYPSTGCEVEGFEIKVSRSDWLNELKHPEKASQIMQYCDRWWVVAPKGVVEPAELPKTWGLMIATEKTVRVEVKAPLLKAEDFDRPFIASLLRSATDGVIPQEMLRTEQKKSYEDGAKNNIKKVESAERQLEKYKGQVAIFEKASSIKILESSDWGETEEKIKKVGKLVNFVLDGGIRSLKWDVDAAVDRAEEVVKELKKVKEFSDAAKEIDINGI